MPDPLVIVAVACTEVPEGIVTIGAVTDRVDGPVLEPPPPQAARVADTGISKIDNGRIAFSFRGHCAALRTQLEGLHDRKKSRGRQ